MGKGADGVLKSVEPILSVQMNKQRGGKDSFGCKEVSWFDVVVAALGCCGNPIWR